MPIAFNDTVLRFALVTVVLIEVFKSLKSFRISLVLTAILARVAVDCLESDLNAVDPIVATVVNSRPTLAILNFNRLKFWRIFSEL